VGRRRRCPVWQQRRAGQWRRRAGQRPRRAGQWPQRAGWWPQCGRMWHRALVRRGSAAPRRSRSSKRPPSKKSSLTVNQCGIAVATPRSCRALVLAAAATRTGGDGLWLSLLCRHPGRECIWRWCCRVAAPCLGRSTTCVVLVGSADTSLSDRRGLRALVLCYMHMYMSCACACTRTCTTGRRPPAGGRWNDTAAHSTRVKCPQCRHMDHGHIGGYILCVCFLFVHTERASVVVSS
jgi:hypothetical protein